MNTARLMKMTIVAMVFGLISGCAIGPDYQRPLLEMPAAFPEQIENRADSLNQIPTNWWTLYGDSTLNNLVADAFKKNADIKIAAAQVEEADAVLRQANASIFPEIDLGATGSRARVSNLLAVPNVAPLTRDDRRVAASTSFEIDFWGKLRRASEAARAQALASVYGREVVSQSLAGTTVQTYFLLRSLDAQITASFSSLKTREESLGVTVSRAAAGLSSELDVNLATGALADLAAQLKELERQRTIVEHQLALITVNANLRLPRGDIQSLPIPPSPPVDLPSNLLDRRPDIRAAEQNLVAANAQVGIAKAAMFPTISLTGLYGGQSAALENLLESGGRIWSAGFGLTVPIFDAGRNSARVAQVEARQQQALFYYQRTVAIAFREVADAVTNLRLSKEAEAFLQTRARAARDSMELARARYDAGYSPYLDVLDAQRSANDAELSLVRNRQSQLGYSMDLMKSLGGGWSAPMASGS